MKILGLAAFFIFVAAPAFAQNTKGDRAEVGSPRQTRFKTKAPKKTKVKNSYNRVTPGRFSLANAARSINRSRKPGKSRNVYSQNGANVNNSAKKPQKKQRAWRGTSSGSRVVVRRPSGKSRNVYSQNGANVNNSSRKPQTKQRAWRRTSSGARVVTRTPSNRPSNRDAYPRNNSHSNKPQNPQPPVISNRSTLARLNRLQGSPKGTRPGKKKKVTPRSASRSYIRNKTINTNAGFWNVRRKGEVATTTDLAGQPLRKRNYQTPARSVIKPTINAAYKRKRIGDHAYKGPAAGRYKSATRTSERAWTGDIAGRRIRGKNYQTKIKLQGQAVNPPKRGKPGRIDRISHGRIRGGGYKSASKSSEQRTGISPLPRRAPGLGSKGIGNYSGKLFGGRPPKGGGSVSGKSWNNKGNPLLGKAPGIGANGIGNFKGNLKGGRPLKGGGSVSGRLWNNNGSALQARPPGKGQMGIGTFQGNIKGGRPLKGGGSVSGRLWNNNGNALQARPPGKGQMGIGSFQGNIKGGRPLKGGGSVSGRLWNNNGNALQARPPGKAQMGIGTFQGNIKGGRPLKGGGSVSGRLWNNNGSPLQVRQPGKAQMGIGSFQGNIKGGRPLKGGGSVSGKLWNNKETPLPVRTPPPSAAKVGGFPGHYTIFDIKPGLNDQGEEFTGVIKSGNRFKKGYLHNPLTAEKAIDKRRPNKTTYDVDNLQVKVKRRDYIVNKNSSEDALKKLEPTKATLAVGNLQVKVKRRNYIVNKNSSEDALKKLEPTKATLATGNLQIKVKRRNYIVNKNSSEDALKKLEPTKATLAVGNLQIKVKQFHYIHNSSSAKEALNVRDPGKAFARATDYQGNIKMKKFDVNKLFSQRSREMHPDAQFVKTNKNNVASERDFMTNIKLWWGRTFRKNETQPDNLKERERKPRYDKGEQGLWNE